MRTILLLTFSAFIFDAAVAQGVSFSYSTANTLSADLFFKVKKNRFHLGLGVQFDGQKKTIVRKRKPNYGLTVIGDGNFFRVFDMGYSRVLWRRLTISSELSLGSRHMFTNYADDRFGDNSYTLIRQSRSIAGIGLAVGYVINKYIEIFAEAHTLKKVNFGARFVFL